MYGSYATAGRCGKKAEIRSDSRSTMVIAAYKEIKSRLERTIARLANHMQAKRCVTFFWKGKTRMQVASLT